MNELLHVISKSWPLDHRGHIFRHPQRCIACLPFDHNLSVSLSLSLSLSISISLSISLSVYIYMFKDFSMVYRALWYQRHEWAMCYAPRYLMYPGSPWVTPISQCTVHQDWILLWHELFGFDILRNRNLLANVHSGRWPTVHCKKIYTFFVCGVYFNAFVT